MNYKEPDFFYRVIRPHMVRPITERPKARKSHLIKQINQALFRDNEKLVVLNKKTEEAECSFVVASTQKERELAFHMAYETYREAGLVPPTTEKRVISLFDAGEEMVTFCALDANEEPAGTISLVFDSPWGLPCDDIFGTETKLLRESGRRLVEVTRLAVKKELTCSHTVLLRLINLIFIYAIHVRKYTDFVIETKPQHAVYYSRKLNFETSGPQKSCPRVQGAPAVLSRLDLTLGAALIRKWGGMTDRNEQHHQRTLYPHFWSDYDGRIVAGHLDHCYSPMSEHEKTYFGLSESKQSKEKDPMSMD